MYGEQKLGWEDKEFIPNLFALFDIASDVVFRLEPIYTNKGKCQISNETINNVKQTKYEELLEDFFT